MNFLRLPRSVLTRLPSYEANEIISCSATKAVCTHMKEKVLGVLPIKLDAPHNLSMSVPERASFDETIAQVDLLVADLWICKVKCYLAFDELDAESYRTANGRSLFPEVRAAVGDLEVRPRLESGASVILVAPLLDLAFLTIEN